MDAVADAVLGAGGQITSVIPWVPADKDIAHHDPNDICITNAMPEHRALMVVHFDGFVAVRRHRYEMLL